MLRFLLFVASVMVANTSTAGGASQCPVINTVPIQIISSGSGAGPVTTLSAARIAPDPSSPFDTFVKTVTEHVATRLAGENLCLDSAESKARSLLQFVGWSISTRNKPRVLAPPLDAHPADACRITSPWIDLVFERKPVPSIRGIVRWNQRQLLADQAVLAGAKNVPSGVAMQMTDSEFLHFLGEYQISELFSKRPVTKPTEERVSPSVVKPLEERVPSDLLWLLRRSLQSGNHHVPFFNHVNRSMRKATEMGADSYTKLVIALIDRCFAADGANLHYNNILDVADLISLEQYKIVTPLY